MYELFNSSVFWSLSAGIAFIGFILGRITTANKYRKELEKCQLEKSALVNNLQSNPENYINAQTQGIRAVQTRGRSGSVVETNEPKVVKKAIRNEKPDLERMGFASESEKDDLKQIEGIGPFIEKQLNSCGIYTFEQISRMEEEDMRQITRILEFFPGRIERDNWKKQAVDLMSVKIEA
ncbi:hypothetical protein [Robertkochia solimangrovi]|uniref:hypothetical protein n=1 Tax=Robertkochia solimangrovi TaxID=2213046 RepID=UPI0011802E8B|nr:hypothetical protein [Robertkochia solimangrovi]TRZ45239.1 hypothetical protein DMZ48_05680 [Robertkochia solimangrovi]